MLAEELINLIADIQKKRCETQDVELKSALGGTPKKLYDTLSSFSNQSGGGIIIFGVDEEKDYQICGVYDARDLQKKVTQQSEQMIPVVRPLFTVAQLEGKTVVSAEIAECDVFDKPCYYGGAGRLRGSYIRVGDADLPMSEYEIYSYEAFKRKKNDELRLIPEGVPAPINENKLIIFIAELKSQKPNLGSLNDDAILELCGIYLKTQLTLTGLLLFGLFPQGAFPQLCITAVVVPGAEIGIPGDNEERFIDNKKIEGTIPQMINGAISFVQRNMHVKTIIDENGRRIDQWEYPVKAIREIVLNAVIHRDYSIYTENSPIRIMMFPDRLEVENPGGLYGRISVDDLGKVGADTRNPYLASNLEIMMNTENRFSGIPTIRNEMKRAGLPEPEFKSFRGIFKVTLYNGEPLQHKLQPHSNEEKKLLDFCNIPRSRKEIAGFLGIQAVSYAINKYVLPLVDAGKLKMTIPDKPKSKNQKFIRQ